MSGKKKKGNWFMEQLKANTFAIIFWASTVGFSIFNIYLASQLTPIVKNIDILTGRIEAIEISRSDTKPLVERFYKLEEKVDSIQEDIHDIKNYLLN